jgi:hypothetical protein
MSSSNVVSLARVKDSKRAELEEVATGLFDDALRGARDQLFREAARRCTSILLSEILKITHRALDVVYLELKQLVGELEQL